MSEERQRDPLTTHWPGVFQSLVAAAVGGGLLPAVKICWEHIFHHPISNSAEGPLANAIAALVLIPTALILTRLLSRARKRGIHREFNEGGPSESLQLRSRNTVVRLVRRKWVRGVLEQPLYRLAKIDLGLDEVPGASGRQMELTVQSGASSTRRVDPTTSMESLLDELCGFLILGEAGIGKSTLLAELVRDLIARAEKDPSAPVPIALSLAKWTDRRGPIANWLVRELVGAAPAEVIERWMNESNLVLLLDALDEVSLEHREECVGAINQFHVEWPSMQIVVSCRSDDYSRLTAKLDLHGAVVLRALSPHAIDAAVERAGSTLKGLRGVIDRIPELYEVLGVPLMLDVARVAYANYEQAELTEGSTVQQLKRQLFQKVRGAHA